MTLREIDRQLEHWRLAPPAAFTLVRIGYSLGLKPPRPAPTRPSAPSGAPSPMSQEELAAMGAAFGLSHPPPWVTSGS